MDVRAPRGGARGGVDATGCNRRPTRSRANGARDPLGPLHTGREPRRPRPRATRVAPGRVPWWERRPPLERPVRLPLLGRPAARGGCRSLGPVGSGRYGGTAVHHDAVAGVAPRRRPVGHGRRPGVVSSRRSRPDRIPRLPAGDVRQRRPAGRIRGGAVARNCPGARESDGTRLRGPPRLRLPVAHDDALPAHGPAHSLDLRPEDVAHGECPRRQPRWAGARLGGRTPAARAGRPHHRRECARYRRPGAREPVPAGARGRGARWRLGTGPAGTRPPWQPVSACCSSAPSPCTH